MIDLHIHSTCSDGTFTPKQIVQKVIAKGLYGFSLTDQKRGLDIAFKPLFALSN